MLFIREKNRRATTPWDSLAVDENSGRVYCRESVYSGSDQTQLRCAGGELYRENTYMTIQRPAVQDSIYI